MQERVAGRFWQPLLPDRLQLGQEIVRDEDEARRKLLGKCRAILMVWGETKSILVAAEWETQLDMAFVAMFDEVDEGTAIFKVSNTPPTQAYFVTYEGKPADWYLRLTAEGTKIIAGERPNTGTIPISP